MPLSVRSERFGEAVVVALEGDVDLATVGRLRDVLVQTALDRPAGDVIVDLDGVLSLDDAGLGILLGRAGATRAGGGQLTVVCSRPELRDRLAVTGFDRAVPVVDRLAAIG